jgi:peroxiredoxin
LVQLQTDLKKIEAAGVQVVAFSYDKPEVLARFAERRKITFPLLSDPDSTVIKAFGLLNKEARGKAAGVPYPGTFLLDKDGVIRAKLFLDGYRERHSTEELIKAVQGIN